MLWLLGNGRQFCGRGFQKTLLARHYKAEPVTRDVVLFEHRRPRFFRLLGVFCVAQTSFWAYLAHFGYSTLRDIKPSNKDEKVKGRNMGSPLWRTAFTLGCLSMGLLVMAAGLLYSRRSVSSVTLHAGGDKVTIVTAGVFGISSSFNLPLRHISCMAHRSEVPAMLPLKIKGRPLYYLIDKKGHVSNATLFDRTIGAYRSL